MKTSRSLRILTSTLAALLLGTSATHAAPFAWDGGAIGNNWTLDNNWNPNTQPPSDGTADLIFAGTTELGPDANNPWSIRSLSFASNAGAFTITGQTLTIGSGGITNDDNTAQTIDNAIILVSAQTWDTTGAGDLRIRGSVNTNGDLLTFAPTSGNVRVSSAISGSGGVTVATGDVLNTVIFEGSTANTYTGPTAVNAGVLTLSKNAGVNAIAGDLIIGDGTGSERVALGRDNQIANTSNVTVNSSGTFDHQAIGAIETINILTVNGGLVNIQGGELTVSSAIMTGGSITSTSAGSFNLNGNVTTNASAAAANITADVDFNGGTRTFTVADDGTTAVDLTLSGELFNGGVTKAGAGTMRLSGTTNNLHFGATTVTGGVLELAKTGAVSALLGPLTINTSSTVRLAASHQLLDAVDVTIGGGTFDLNGFSETIDTLSMTGGSVNTGAGTLTVGGNITATAAAVSNSPAIISGALNLGGGTRTVNVTENAAAPLDAAFVAAIANGALIKTGAGTLRLAGNSANTYTGTTTVNDGTLELDKTAGVNAIAGPLVIDGAIVRLERANQIADGSPVTVGNFGLLVLNGLAETIGSLTLIDGDVVGGGSLTLGGDVTTGGTQPAEILSASLNLGGATRTFNVANAPMQFIDLSVNGGISNGGITKAGAGTLRLAVANSFAGGLTVNAGEVAFANDAAAGTGTLTLNAGVSIRAESAARTLNNPATLGGDFTIGGALALTLSGPLTLTGNRTVTVANTALTTFSGALGQNAAGRTLTKAGAGTLTISGPQNYSALVVTGGVVNLETPLGSGASTLAVTPSAGNATVNIDADQTLAALTIGAGGVVHLSAQSAAAVQAVPEPGALTLLASALLARWLRRPRRVAAARVAATPSSQSVAGGASPPEASRSTRRGRRGHLRATGVATTRAPAFPHFTACASRSDTTPTNMKTKAPHDTARARARASRSGDLQPPSHNSSAQRYAFQMGASRAGFARRWQIAAPWACRLACALLALATTAFAAPRTWSGGAISNDFWSDDDNWAGGVSPVTGDALIFPSGIQNTDKSMRNNLNSTVLLSLRFEESGYSIDGDPVRISGGFTGNHGASFDSGIQLMGDQTFALPSAALVVTGLHADLNVNGFTLTLPCLLNVGRHLVGGGAIIVDGGEMRLFDESSFAGPITVRGDGLVLLQASLEVSPFATLGSAAAPTFIADGTVVFIPSDDETVLETLHLDGGAKVRVRKNTTAFPGAITLTLAGPIILGGAGVRTIECFGVDPISTVINGRISGAGDLEKSGPLALHIGGFQANTFGGSFTAVAGSVVLTKPAGVAALSCADVTLDGGSMRIDANEQIADTSRLRVRFSSTFNLNGKTETIGALEMTSGIVSGNSPSLFVVAGNITSLAAASSAQLNVNARITGAPTILAVANGAAADDFVSTVSLNGAAGSSLRKTGAGRANLNEFTGNRPVEIQQGELVLGSAQGSAVTLNGGTLAGDSAIGMLTSAAGGGTIAPGASIGTISCTTVTLNAATTFAVEMQSAAAGGGDVLDANFSTVNLGGATLAVSLLPDFNLGLGSPVVILDNDGVDAIVGTFAGLPEGAEVTVGGLGFRISYTGGTGNDVTLALTSVPPSGQTRFWTGGAASDGIDQAANWNPAVVPQPGDQLVFPSGPTDKNVVDNIAGTTPYNQLVFNAPGYTVAGSGLALIEGISSNFSGGEARTSLPLVLTQDARFIADGGAQIVVTGSGIPVVDLAGHTLTLNTRGGGLEIGVDSIGLGPSDGIHGNGGLIKQGVGTARLKCFNSYTGPTVVAQGVLQVQNGGGLGASGAANVTTVASGASLSLAPLAGTVLSVPEDVVLEGGLLSNETNATPGAVNTLSGALTLPAPRTVFVGSGQLALSGVVQGAGSPSPSGGGELILSGAAANTFTGHVVVSGGLLSLQKTAGVAAIGTGGVRIISGATMRLLAAEQIAGDVVIDGGTFALGSFNETLPTLTLRSGATVTGSGTLTLAGQLGVSGGAATIFSPVAISGASQTFAVSNGASADDLTVSGVISGAQVVKTGGGRAVFSGNNTLGNLRIEAGPAIFLGNSSATAVNLAGGTLGGTGTVGAITSSAGGAVAPGLSTGLLASGAVAWSATTQFAVELTTPTPGTGHDQLNVTGAVNLGGAQLVVTLLAGFSATTADTFVILHNDGADAITGTFAGLPQNATFSIDGKTFRISYTGGTGNDVTLRLFQLGTGIVRRWDGGGADNKWTTPANWDGNVTAPSAGDDLEFPLLSSQRVNVNDFPVGTTFNSISLAGFAYSLSGAGVVLNNGLSFDAGASSCLLPITLAQAQTFTATNGAVGTINPSTSLQNGGFALTLHAANAAARLVVSDVAGLGALRKTGPGGATLATNTHTGANEFLEGEVLLDTTATGLGATTGTLIAAAATLRLNAVAATTVTPPLTLGGRLLFASSPVTFSGAISLSASDAGVVEVTGAGIPALSGAITGAGGLRKIGAGELTLSGAAANTFSGGLFVEAGVLRAQKTPASGLTPGPVTIGDGTATAAELRYLNANQLPSIGVTLDGAGAHYNLNGLVETIGSLAMTGGTVSAGPAPATALSLSSGLVTTFAAATPATINGQITAAVAGVRFWNIEDGAAADDLVLTGSVASFGGFTMVKSGEGRVVFAGNATFPTLRLEFGAAVFTGNGAGVAVQLGAFGGGQATLTGSGFTGAITTPTVLGGKIAPGGILTASGNTAWNGETRLQLRLLNTTPGAGHDQLSVLGTPTLGEAQLEVTLQPGFVPVFGQTFKIIDNNGNADPVVGTFAGLPEGALLDVDGTMFRISYLGGDGNDVTLTTAMLAPTGTTRVWDGGSGNNASWTTPANWVGDVAPVAGDALEFPATAGQKNNTNDFPANTTFDSIRIAGNSYVLNGANSIVLNSGLHAVLGIGVTSFHPPLVLAQAQSIVVEPGATLILENGATIATGGHVLTLDMPDFGLGAGILSLRGVVSGAGSLVKTGAGTLFLLGNNTFTGTVNIAAGSVQVGHDNALGATTAGTTVQTGARLNFNQSGLTVAENIALAEFAQINSITGTNQLTGTLSLLGPGAVTLSCTSPAILSGVITGPGGFFKTLAADLTISGTAANTFTGGLVLSRGTARLQKTAGIVALPGPVFIGDAVNVAEVQLLAANQIADTAVVQVVKNATFNCSNLAETIAALQMTEGTVSTGTGTLTIDGTLETFAAANTATITGNIAVKAPASGTRTWTIADGAATDDLTMNAVVSSTPSSVKLEMSGSGRTRFTASNTISDMIHSDGTAIFTGTNNGTTITLNGGTLGGTGTVSDISSDGGGIVAPGLSAGELSATGKVSWNPRTLLAIELNGLASHDVLTVNGESDLGDAALSLSLGFTPPLGSRYVIYSNRSGSALGGQFAGLPEGAFLAAPGAHIFQITYRGGDGDDVELTRVAGASPTITSFAILPAPVLGFDSVTLTGTGTPGLTYQLETSQDLTLGIWTTQYEETADTITGVLNFMFTQPDGIPQMFYRLRLP